MSRAAFFRAGVGAVILDGTGAILTGRRAKATDNAWQLPQGGIQDGETPEQALYRELGEELHLERQHIRIEATAEEWLVYELPKEYRNEKVGWGQVQKWFLCRLVVARTVATADLQELSEIRWVGTEALISNAAPFRRAVYKRLVEQWQL